MEARFELAKMMCNSKVIGKPLLLLTNKQDCVAVCSNTQIWEALNVEHVMGRDVHLAQMVGCFLFFCFCFLYMFVSHNLSFSLFLLSSASALPCAEVSGARATLPS